MTYNFFYYGQAITKKEFLANVPENWGKEVTNGKYSFGGYRAVSRD